MSAKDRDLVEYYERVSPLKFIRNNGYAGDVMNGKVDSFKEFLNPFRWFKSARQKTKQAEAFLEYEKSNGAVAFKDPSNALEYVRYLKDMERLNRMTLKGQLLMALEDLFIVPKFFKGSATNKFETLREAQYRSEELAKDTVYATVKKLPNSTIAKKADTVMSLVLEGYSHYPVVITGLSDYKARYSKEDMQTINKYIERICTALNSEPSMSTSEKLAKYRSMVNSSTFEYIVKNNPEQESQIKENITKHMSILIAQRIVEIQKAMENPKISTKQLQEFQKELNDIKTTAKSVYGNIPTSILVPTELLQANIKTTIEKRQGKDNASDVDKSQQTKTSKKTKKSNTMSL